MTTEATTPQAAAPVITIDGDTYTISSLPADLQDLIGYYTRWDREHKDALSEVNKCEAACRAISIEVTKRIRELKQAADTMAAAKAEQPAPK